MLVLPYIVKTTEVALRQVPSVLREGAAGLGLPRWATVWKVILPVALPGIVSGLVVALAISTGEMAPVAVHRRVHRPQPDVPAVPPSGRLPDRRHLQRSVPTGPAGPTPPRPPPGAVTLIILIILIVAGHRISAQSRRATARMNL